MPLPLGAVLSQFCPIYHPHAIVFGILLTRLVGLASYFVLEYYISKMYALCVAFVSQSLRTILTSWILLLKKL